MRINDLQVHGRALAYSRAGVSVGVLRLTIPASSAQVILVCFVCAAVALFSPVDYAWIGPVRWMQACAGASHVYPSHQLHRRACVRACVLTLQVACLLVLVCCSDVHRPSFKHTYGYSNAPVQPRN